MPKPARRKNRTRPRVICHMLSGVDGRIDGAALKKVITAGDYEATGESLGGDAWICGRVTMQDFAERRPFVPASKRACGHEAVHVTRRADSYAISVDTLGKLRWSSGDLDGDHLICVVSERAPDDYLAVLRDRGVSYVVTGTPAVDLGRALELLAGEFGIRTLLLEGGGHINGAFLQAGLIDEVSLLLVPGIDGRHGVAAVFDGLGPTTKAAVPLKLKSVKQRKTGSLWIRYKVVRS